MNFERDEQAQLLVYKWFTQNNQAALFKGSMGEIGINGQAVSMIVNLIAHATASLCVTDKNFLGVVMRSHAAMVDMFAASGDENAKALVTTLAEILLQAIKGTTFALEKLDE